MNSELEFYSTNHFLVTNKSKLHPENIADFFPINGYDGYVVHDYLPTDYGIRCFQCGYSGNPYKKRGLHSYFQIVGKKNENIERFVKYCYRCEERNDIKNDLMNEFHRHINNLRDIRTYEDAKLTREYEKIVCTCGKLVSKRNKSYLTKHLRTPSHIYNSKFGRYAEEYLDMKPITEKFFNLIKKISKNLEDFKEN